LLRVLRLRPGEAVSVSDGAGRWRSCVLGDAGRLEASGEVVFVAAPSPSITVAMAVAKGDRPEWAVQKLTEIGVDRIVVLSTARGVVRWDDERAGRHMARLEAIARAAAMQSRRTWLPILDGPVDVASVVAAGASGLGAGGPARGAGGPAPLGAASRGAGGPAVLGAGAIGPAALAEPGGAPPGLAHPTLLVGPEGGWSPEEMAACSVTVSLAPTILRTETAALVGAALLVALRSGTVREGRNAEGADHHC
jgi:16S rRNA (uracil1498-N3)-methyltransferase